MNKALSFHLRWTGSSLYSCTVDRINTDDVYRIRLRKKTWPLPGAVYLDHQFLKDIRVFDNEMFIEPLEGVSM